MSSPGLEVVTELRALNRQSWQTFVDQHPNGSVFQSPLMADLFDAVPEYNATGAAVRSTESGAILGLIVGVVQREGRGVKGWLTARAVVWGGPLVTEGVHSDAVIDLLMRAVSRRSVSGAIFTEIRSSFSLDDYQTALQRHGFEFDAHLNFLVETIDRTVTTSAVGSSRRRQIRKSLKAGAEIGIATTLAEVEAFYRILTDHFRHTVKKPLPPWTFFREFFERRSTADRPGLGQFFVVRYQGSIIAGIMCPISAGKAIHEWYIAGLDRQFTDVNPSVLATWAPIDHALDSNIPVFDFMGAGKPTQDYGVRDFKEKFGGELVAFGRYTRINSRFRYNLGRLGIRVLSMVR